MEIAPVAFLLLLCLVLTVQGGPVMRYMDATAQSLHAPAAYVRDVLSRPAVPGPNAPRRHHERASALSAADGVAARHVAAAERAVVGQVVLGGIIALAASLAMAALQPAKPKLRRWDMIPQLVADRAWRTFCAPTSPWRASSCAAGGRREHPASSMIPLELRDRTGLAVLACIITSTPGHRLGRISCRQRQASRSMCST